MSGEPVYRRASNRYGIWSVAKNLLPLAAIYAVAPYVADRSATLAWALAPVVGLLLYRLTMVMHDCCHGTLFTRRRANTAVGRGLGYLAGIHFDRFKLRHWEHHKRCGSRADPQGFHYRGTAAMSAHAFAWHLIKPLFAFNVRHVFAETWLCPRNLKGATPADDGALLAVQLAVVLLITGGRHYSLALMPPLAAVTVGLFLSQLRGIAEHGVRASGHDGAGFVRSHPADWLGRVLLYDVHFNFHEEHHRYPGIPSCHLPQLFAGEHAGGAAGRTFWSTLAKMVRHPRP